MVLKQGFLLDHDHQRESAPRLDRVGAKAVNPPTIVEVVDKGALPGAVRWVKATQENTCGGRPAVERIDVRQLHFVEEADLVTEAPSQRGMRKAGMGQDHGVEERVGAEHDVIGADMPLAPGMDKHNAARK